MPNDDEERSATVGERPLHHIASPPRLKESVPKQVLLQGLSFVRAAGDFIELITRKPVFLFPVEIDETRTSTSASGALADEMFNPETDVSIRIGREPLAQVWEIPEEESFYINCKKKGPVGRDWIQIVGILVDTPSE